MTPGEIAIMATQLLILLTAFCNLLNSLSNRSTLHQIKGQTDGMTERLEIKAHAAGVAEGKKSDGG